MELQQWEGVWPVMLLVFCNFFLSGVLKFPTIELEDLSYGSEGN